MPFLPVEALGLLSQTDAATLLVENADFGVIILDAQLLVVGWNPWMAARTGLAPEAARERPFQEVFPRLPEATLEVFKSVLENGLARVLSPQLHAAWGDFPEAMRQYVRLLPLRDRSDAIIGILVMVQDMTGPLEFEEEIERLNRQMAGLLADLQAANARLMAATNRLEEANADLETFAYSISHDLRAPLRAIQGFAALLRQSGAESVNAASLEYLGRIDAAANRMDALIQDLLAYSRIRRTEVDPTPVHLDSLMAEVLQQMELDILERRAVVEVEGPLRVVSGHRAILMQILTNLIGNALKFTSADVTPHVRICSETIADKDAPAARLRLWIEDNGIGIEPRHHEQIFNVFERLHHAEQYPGTGIGLAIVQQGMARMGGRAGVESSPGKGSRFWIELPAPASQ